MIGLYGAIRGEKAVCLAAMALAVALCVLPARAAVSQERMLVPVGHTVGVKLFAQGVMVVKLPDGNTPARESGLRSGDVIVRCEGTPVTSAEQFRALLQESEEAHLEVSRNGGALSLCVETEKNEDGVACIGAWVRDSMAGIGTMTWYDPATGAFGALGHGITDVDTAKLMPFRNGSILPSTVKAVKRGESGIAGELRGDFDLSRDLGTLWANTSRGIFGNLTAEDYSPVQTRVYPTGSPVKGPATILSNVRGDAVEAFAVEIVRVMPGSEDGRDMVLSVTDPALLDATGGIVQGMSGSPVLQDGKLVGAVTHVFLHDPTRGYGIAIHTMLDETVS